jgi:transcriptional regulator with XRE-family HTH domain
MTYRTPPHTRLEEWIDRHVGHRLRVLREQSPLEISDIATELHVSVDELERHESEQVPITAGRLFMLAAILDVPISAFFDAFHVEE